MDLRAAIGWTTSRKHAVLITLRRDGRAQSSDMSYAVDGDTFAISLTDSRAKTHNMRRDPRIVLHITEPGSWSYVSFDGVAELSAVARQPDDAICDDLCAYYEAVAGQPHPDWKEYREAMVAEGRMLLRLRPDSAVGQIH